MRPGISVSAIVSSFLPKSERPMSATTESKASMEVEEDVDTATMVKVFFWGWESNLYGVTRVSA